MDYILSVEGYNINHLAANLSWSSNQDTMGQSLSFELPFDINNGLLPPPFVKVGDKVTLKYKSQIIFFGIVESEGANGRSPRSFTCYDLSYYLNESTLTIQFRNKPAIDCIKEICKRFGIKCTVANLPFKITKVYIAEKVSDILRDILDICSKRSAKKYRLEMRGDALTVFNWRDIKVNVDMQTLHNPSRTTSMAGMKNSVEIVSGDEKKVKVAATVKDSNSIKKYGLLHHSEQIDEKEKAKAKQVADNLLKEFNRLSVEGTVSFVGNHEARAGRIITLDEPITGFKGDYNIKDAQHSISGGIHLMTLNLEVLNG